MSRYDQILGDEQDSSTKTTTNISAKATIGSLDPRRDIISDHRIWELVLTNAKALFDTHKPANDAGETSLFKILHGLRCGGAKLEETKQAYKLLPGDEDFADPAEWDKTKQRWLNPVKDDLVALFKLCKVGRVVDGELPEEVARVFSRAGQSVHTTEEQQKIEFNVG